MMNKYGSGPASLYFASAARNKARRALAEATDPQQAEANLTIILRDAIHHYGEALRTASSLPDDSPEKLNTDNLYRTFRLAKSSLGSSPAKIVVEQLLLDLRKHEGMSGSSEFFDGLVTKLSEVGDALPVDDAAAEPGGENIQIPATEDGPKASPDKFAPDLGEGGEGDGAGGEGKDGEGGEEADGPEAGEVSEEEFASLVKGLKGGK